jgi:CRP-like cAMP-binding protein
VFVLQLLMFGPNQYFAENALLGDYTYRASAVAKGRVTVLRTSCEDFNMVCNLAPQHGQTFLA